MGDQYPDHGSRAASKTPLESILARCQGAYSDNTLRAYAADLRLFEAWCAARGRSWLPADTETVAAFIDHEVDALSPSTLKRRLSSITFAHRMADLANPTTASDVLLAVRRAVRRKNRRPAQSKGLTSEILNRILQGLPETLAGLRDAALISVGYDTLCRSAELSAMTVAHLRRSSGGDWSVLVPRSKADPGGDGRLAWLSPATVGRLTRWLDGAQISEGYLFRSLHLSRVAEGSLDTSSIRRLIKRAGTSAGIDADVAKALSGHSMRVGAAQDMLVSGFDAVAIMQAGGWRTTAVLLRYVENASTRALHERRWKAC